MMYIGQNINCILFVLKVNGFNKADPSQMPDCPDNSIRDLKKPGL